MALRLSSVRVFLVKRRRSEMGTKLSLVALAAIVVFAMGAAAAGPGPTGPISPGPYGGPNGPNGDAVQVEGEIVDIALELDQLTVGDVTVQITPDTVIWIGEEVVGLDALAELAEEGGSVTVVVCGVFDEDGVLWANRINVKFVGQ
jgi:hypothetical protein